MFSSRNLYKYYKSAKDYVTNTLPENTCYSENTRFGRTIEFQDLISTIRKLHVKEEELEKEVGDNAGDKGYLKYKAVSKIISKLDAEIIKFNQKHSYKNEAEDILALIKSLRNITDNGINTYKEHLLIKRNQNKEIAKGAVVATTATGAAAVSISTGSFMSGIGVVQLGREAYDVVCDKSGLNDPPMSYILFNKLSKKLLMLEKQLRYEREIMRCEEAKQRGLKCPLSGESFKFPVVCILDDTIYERNNLIDFLKDNGFAPGNNEPIPQGKNISDVIIDYASLDAEFDSRLESETEEEEEKKAEIESPQKRMS